MAVGFSEPDVDENVRVADSLASVLVVLEAIKDRDDVAHLSADLARLEDSIREVIATAPGGAGHSRPSRLSKRELNVLRHVASGQSNKQVALRLGISEWTVRNHLTRIFGKLGAVTRTEAVVRALRLGLLTI